jgi:hypothetical protein
VVHLDDFAVHRRCDVADVINHDAFPGPLKFVLTLFQQ